MFIVGGAAVNETRRKIFDVSFRLNYAVAKFASRQVAKRKVCNRRMV
jgi:hypothetical protein